jgi:6-phosphogluconolactonase (cycloisomerase 2 family)
MHIPLSPDGNFVRNPLVNAITVRLSKWPTPFKHPRQDAPHAHQIVIHGDEILIPDLGTNLVLRQYPPRHGRQWNAGGVVMGYKEGDGPRHVAVHPRGMCHNRLS